MSTRWLGLCVAVYAPHLLEEHVMEMHDDPMLVSAFDRAFAGVPAREASYLVFQLMMIVALVAAYLSSLGGRARDAVLAALALALLAESHHVIRALATLHYNAGALTSLPMPILGAAIALSLVRAPRVGAPVRASV
jgi:hypothetical protein